MVRAPDPDGAGAGNYTPPPRLGHINIGSLDSDPVGANDGDMYYNVNSQGLRVYDWTDSAWKQLSTVRIVASAPYGNTVYYQGQFAWNTAEQTLYVANSTTAGAGPTGYWDWRPAVNLSAYAPLSSPSFEGTVNFGTSANVTVNFGVSPKSSAISVNGTLTVENYSGIELKSASREIRWLNGNGAGYTQLSDTYAGTGNITINLPNTAGTLIGTGDTGSVTDAMLAGSISPSKVTGTAAVLGANTFTSGQTVTPTTGSALAITGAPTSGSPTTVIAAGADANVGLRIRQNSATQSANLLEVTAQNGTTMLVRVDSAGNLVSGIGTYTNTISNTSTGNNAQLSLATTGITASTAVAGNIPLIIKNLATATTNLTEWRNTASNTLVRYVDLAGRHYASQAMFNGLDQYSSALSYLSDSAIPQDIWTDKLRFRPGYYETSTDGTTWTFGTYNLSVTDGRIDTTVNVTTSPSYYRWSWQASDISWSSALFVRLTTTYSGTTNQFSLTVESSADGTTWTNRNYGGSALTGLGNSGGQARYIAAINSYSGDGYFRVTIRNTGANTIPIAAIELLTPRAGDQGGPTPGLESNLPMSWDANKTVVLTPSSQAGTGLITRPMQIVTNAVAGASGTGTVVTYTTTNPHGLVTGQTITVSGTNGGLYDIANAAAITVTGYKTFTISASNTGTWTSGGTVTMTPTGNSQQWRGTSDNVLSSVDRFGNFTMGWSARLGATLDVTSNSNNNQIAVLVRGHGSASTFTQAVDLQQWQVFDGTTATTVSRIDKNGCLIAAEPQGSTTSGAGTTVTLDCSVSTTHNLTFGAGNITGILLTNVPRNGSFTVTLVLKQDSVGGRTITWSGNQINGSATNATPKWAGGTAPTLSTAANAVDIVTLVVNRTNNATDAVYGFLAGKAFA